MIYYLYVRQYRILANAELNFDANHRYHFDADRRRLELTTVDYVDCVRECQRLGARCTSADR